MYKTITLSVLYSVGWYEHRNETWSSI